MIFRFVFEDAGQNSDVVKTFSQRNNKWLIVVTVVAAVAAQQLTFFQVIRAGNWKQNSYTWLNIFCPSSSPYLWRNILGDKQRDKFCEITFKSYFNIYPLTSAHGIKPKGGLSNQFVGKSLNYVTVTVLERCLYLSQNITNLRKS